MNVSNPREMHGGGSDVGETAAKRFADVVRQAGVPLTEVLTVGWIMPTVLRIGPFRFHFYAVLFLPA